MSDYPFFRSVSVARPNLKMFPLGILRSKSKQYISGSNDSFHCLKAFTLHHNSASRTVFYGLFAVDLRCLLRAGLPVSAYTNRDAQSDTASFMRLNTRFLEDNWECDGVRVFMFLGELISSTWSCGLGPEATFRNAMTAWYLLLIQVSEAKRIQREGAATSDHPQLPVCGGPRRSCVHLQLQRHAMEPQRAPGATSRVPLQKDQGSPAILLVGSCRHLCVVP